MSDNPFSVSDQKIIVVVGAVGLEGTAVVKAFDNLRNNTGSTEFHVRAVVPQVESSEALELQPIVDEMYGSLHLEKALAGAYGVYIANDYFVDCDVEREVSLLKKVQKMIQQSSSIEHVVLSCSEDTRPFVTKRNDVLFWNKMNGNMFCPPMDAKGGLADAVAATIPTTKLYPAVLLEYFSHYMKPLETTEKGYVLKLPLERGFALPVVAASDVGAMACAIFQDSTLTGVTCGVTSELITPVEIAGQLSQTLGVPIAYQKCPVEEFAQSGLAGAEELANMFKYMSLDTKYALRRKIPIGLKPMMGPYTQSFASWAEQNVEALKSQWLGYEAAAPEEEELGKYSSFVPASESQVEHLVGGTGETEWA